MQIVQIVLSVFNHNQDAFVNTDIFIKLKKNRLCLVLEENFFLNAAGNCSVCSGKWAKKQAALIHLTKVNQGRLYK